MDVYPMTSVKVSGEMGCWEMRDFPTPSGVHSHRSWEPMPIDTFQRGNRRRPRNREATGQVFLGPDSCLIGNYVISQQAWVLTTLLHDRVIISIQRVGGVDAFPTSRLSVIENIRCGHNRIPITKAVRLSPETIETISTRHNQGHDTGLASLSHPHMHYSKNPYPVRNHIIPNEAIIGVQEQ